MPSTVDRKVRRERGKAIAATCKITEKNGFYLVPSQTGNGFHRVKLDPLPFVPGCSCKDYEANQEDCKHVHAVRFYLDGLNPPDKPMSDRKAATLLKRTCAKRPNYPQNWPAYDAAQIHEKEKFLDLLRDLCRGIPEPARKGDPAQRGTSSGHVGGSDVRGGIEGLHDHLGPSGVYRPENGPRQRPRLASPALHDRLAVVGGRGHDADPDRAHRRECEAPAICRDDVRGGFIRIHNI